MAHLYSQPHPGLSAAPSEREWTRDMDDMLRLHLRRSGFDFDAAAAQLHHAGGVVQGIWKNQFAL